MATWLHQRLNVNGYIKGQVDLDHHCFKRNLKKSSEHNVLTMLIIVCKSAKLEITEIELVIHIFMKLDTLFYHDLSCLF